MTHAVSWTARSSNTAAARLEALRAALAEIPGAVNGGLPADAQTWTKRALEALHELNDCRERGEWSQEGWTDDDLDLWRAHIGARNAAHHSSSHVVALRSDGLPAERLTWDVDEAAIADLRSQAPRASYQARLAGRPVLPALSLVAARVDESLPTRWPRGA